MSKYCTNVQDFLRTRTHKPIGVGVCDQTNQKQEIQLFVCKNSEIHFEEKAQGVFSDIITGPTSASQLR